MARRKVGAQKPTFSVVGKYAYSNGSDAVELFGEYGVSFYESQAYELELFLARDKTGRYAAMTIGISKPRQNGKSFAARHYAAWMAAVEGKKVLYSAHHGKTVRKMFKALADLFEQNEDLRGEVKLNGGIYRAAGSEGIYLNSGGMIEFQTRTASGGRGETYDVIIIDEAQELTDDQLEALKPTTFASESGDPQTIYLGTPPGPKCPGTVFRDLHDKAHEGELGNAWWLEWAVEDVPDTSDRALVKKLIYQTNPALGYRIREEVLMDALDTMSADGFAREVLGWWSKTRLAQHVINAAEWELCRTDTPPADGVMVYAVKFAPDGSAAALAVCVKPSDGTPYVEVITTKSLAHGIGWLVDWLVERKGNAANIVIDGRSYAETLVDKLLLAKVSRKALVVPTSRDMAAACATMLNAVKEEGVQHYGQPGLDASAVLSIRRDIGRDGGFGFESTPNADASLIEACSLALWQALRTKRNPKRKQRVG